MLSTGPARHHAVDEASVGGRPIRLTTSVDPPDLVVTADSARLAQVVANQIDNAVRHSPSNGTVHLAAATRAGHLWSLEVTDEGPGIPVEQAQRVFTRFGVGDDSSGGTGLGLAIASWIAQLHGGSITALPPAPGSAGARILVVLPRASRAATPPPVSATAPPAPAPAATPPTPRRPP
ncbi:sensor histidine kinase [Arthrobacter sp. Hz1]